MCRTCASLLRRGWHAQLAPRERRPLSAACRVYPTCSDKPGRSPGGYALCSISPNFRRLGEFGDLALLVVDQQEEVKIADGGRAAGSLDHRLPPSFVVRVLRCLDRRPDVDAGTGPAVELKQEVLTQQFLVGAPFRDHIARLFGHLTAAPALRRIEFDQFKNHAALLLFRFA